MATGTTTTRDRETIEQKRARAFGLRTPTPPPAPRPTPKPVEGRCSLRLRINGATYRVRPVKPEAFGVIKAFALAQPGSEPYTIAETIEGPTCDCGDFVWRRDGTGEPCKHLAAARACGLL